MNRKALVTAIMALFVTAGGPAFSQGYGDRDDRSRHQQTQRSSQQDYRDQGRREADRRHQSDRRADRRDDRREDRRDQWGRGNGDGRWEGRGVGPGHRYHRGERLPVQYRHRNYVVDDWRGHRLHAPPRGHHWVQVGGDYVLVAIATGIIVQLMLNN